MIKKIIMTCFLLLSVGSQILEVLIKILLNISSLPKFVYGFKESIIVKTVIIITLFKVRIKFYFTNYIYLVYY